MMGMSCSSVLAGMSLCWAADILVVGVSSLEVTAGQKNYI